MKKLKSIQCLRGFASLAVVLFHGSASLTSGDNIFRLGFLGVDFFFVLSGYIILSSHYDDRKDIRSVKVYLIKRFVRIFPAYWPISVLMILVYFGLPNLSGVSGAGSTISIPSSLFLLPDTQRPALNVAWTLVYELLFYIIFVAFFVSNRFFVVLLVGWSCLIGVGLALNGVPQAAYDAPGNLLSHILSPLNIEFLCGLSVAYCSRIISNSRGVIYFIFGILVFFLMLYFDLELEYRFLFGFPFSLVVLGAVFFESKRNIQLPSWFVKLGDASYSIYLVHNPLISVIRRVVGQLSLSTSIGMLAGTVVSIAGGFLYYRFVEMPLTGRFRNFFRRFFV